MRFIISTMLMGMALTNVYGVIFKPPAMRISGTVEHLKVDPKGHWLAYIDQDDRTLKIMEKNSGKIYAVTNQKVGNSFFFAPDGYRLFFRELKKSKTDGTISSAIKVFDTQRKKVTLVEDIPHPTGYLTFDPRDQKMRFLFKDGIKTKQIYYTGQRLARWQTVKRDQPGQWIANKNGILWASLNGLKIFKLNKDQDYSVQSFDISRDGDAIAWATEKGEVYVSENGGEPKLIGKGLDPKWHPRKKLVIFAAARTVGKSTVRNYDLKVTNMLGEGKFITNTQYSNERWPTWLPEGNKLVYTKDRTNDIFEMKF